MGNVLTKLILVIKTYPNLNNLYNQSICTQASYKTTVLEGSLTAGYPRHHSAGEEGYEYVLLYRNNVYLHVYMCTSLKVVVLSLGTRGETRVAYTTELVLICESVLLESDTYTS